MAGSDYAELQPATLMIPAGSTNGDMSQCININITDDNALEDNETFTVTLITSEAYVTLGNDTISITISDNDGILISLAIQVHYSITCLLVVTISLSSTPLSVSENGGRISACAILSVAETTQRDFDVILATSQGTGSSNYNH